MSREHASAGRADGARADGVRALVTGWFSFLHGEATAGDLLAAETVQDWLRDRGVDHQVATSPVLDDGPSLEDVDPADFTHLVFVCGPAAGWQLEELLDRFAGCVKVAVGVSVVDGTPDGFDVVISRDGLGDRPDLSLVAGRGTTPPVVGLVRSHPQKEYPDARHDRVHEVVEEALRSCDVAVVELGTRVDPREVEGRRPEDVEAALGRVDAVVTTRMHGLVLALKNGVPAVAVDPVPGGAKVRRQAATLDWPAALVPEELSPERVVADLTWALGPEARARADDCATRARRRLRDEVADELAATLARRPR